MEQTQQMYITLQKERRRFLTVNYMHQAPNDADDIVKTLHNHFQIIKKTCLKSIAQENVKGMGTFDMINRSNSDLRQLRKELDSYVIAKEDLRYEL